MNEAQAHDCVFEESAEQTSLFRDCLLTHLFSSLAQVRFDHLGRNLVGKLSQ